MVFSSILFLLYFLPAFFALFYLAPKSIKNYVALAGSLAFYTWGAPEFVFVLIGSSILDFLIAARMSVVQGKVRKVYLSLGIVLNLGLLVYFKYANFFVHNFNNVLDQLHLGHGQWTDIALPIGISFFTFHKLSYLIDIYRGHDKPMKNIANYLLYILLFPQLIAGPIIRFHEISTQIVARHLQYDKIDDMLGGLLRFIIGLSKKVMIANVLGEEADKIFGLGLGEISLVKAWVGILSYTFQIYFDFSGYSDMAIGLGRMMGFRFPENFDNPYISRNITEFWRRWHISLSRWMRDYLYIPLGGNKVPKSRMYLNLWTVFLISGLWHGASWSFIFWGAYHGFILILDRLFLVKYLHKIGKVPAIFITFMLTALGWVFFRSPDLKYAFGFIDKMFSFYYFSWDLKFAPQRFYLILGVAAISSFIWAIPRLERSQAGIYEPGDRPLRLLFGSSLALILLTVCVSELSASGFNPFIYFRF